MEAILTLKVTSKKRRKKRRIQDNAESFCKTLANLYFSREETGNFKINSHILEL